MSNERYERAVELLGRLKAIIMEVNTFVCTNEVPIREVTGIPPPLYSTIPSIYTSTSGCALILQIYVDSLARNLGEPEAERLPA
jgi:hypothetical protein